MDNEDGLDLLVGKILGILEHFTKTYEKDMAEVKSRLEAGGETFQNIQIRCAERGVVIAGQGDRLEKLEDRVGSPKIQQVKDLGLWATILYMVITILFKIFGLPTPDLPPG